MKKLQHENVVKLHEIIDDPESDELYLSKFFLYDSFLKWLLVMDYEERGQILQWNEREEKFHFTKEHSQEFLKETYLKKIFINLIEGLSYCKLLFYE